VQQAGYFCRQLFTQQQGCFAQGFGIQNLKKKLVPVEWTNFEKFGPGFTRLTSQKIRNLVKFGQILTEIEKQWYYSPCQCIYGQRGLCIPHLSDVVDVLSH